MESEKLLKDVLEKLSKLNSSEPSAFLNGIDEIDELIKSNIPKNINKLVEHYDDRLTSLQTKKKRIKENHILHIEEIRNEIEQMSNHLHDYLDGEITTAKITCPKCNHRF